MSAPHFVRKVKLDREVPLKAGGALAMDRYGALRDGLSEKVGEETARLFAEPVITRGNGVAPNSVSWYAAVGGDPVPLLSLDADARGGPEDLLRARLAALQPVLDDPEVGALARAAVYLPALDDVMVVNGEPVLTNWSLVPPGTLDADADRVRHFQQTLGAYAPFAAPSLDPGAGDPPSGRAAAAAAGAAAAGAAAAGVAGAAGAAGAATPGGDAPPPAGGGGGLGAGGSGGAGLPPGGAPGGPPGGPIIAEDRRRPWVGVLIAVIVSALLLLFLLLPGVLIHPEPPPVVEGPDYDREIALQRDINRALEDQVRNLELALERNICRAEDGTLVLPGMPGYPIQPVPTEPAPTEDGAAPGAEPPAETGTLPADEVPTVLPPSVLPTEPDRTVPPESALVPGQEGFEGSLVDLLDRATVLVAARGSGGAGELGIGSGFFIAPGIVVTNLHVVENADADGIFVTNEALGTVRPARLIHRTADSRIGTDDYAVLSVDRADGAVPLALSPTIARLHNVVAAGFPTLILEADLNFRALLNGDAQAMPGMALTQGVVTVIQNRGRGTPIVAHTAAISPGNSGGPLVDACGRVLGVNTFLLSNEEHGLARANYAIAVDDLMRFLDENGVAHTVRDGDCVPQPRVAEAPPSAEADPPVEADADAAPPGEAPSDEAPPGEAPSDEAPADESPADESPADESPADETPADETPSDEASPDETPPGDAPDAAAPPTDEAPADEAPADEAPADEAPVDDAPPEDGDDEASPDSAGAP